MLPEIAKNKVQPCALLCTLFYMPTLSPELFIKIRLQTTKLTKAGFGVFASRALPSGGTLARFVNHAAGKACFKYFVGFSASLALSLYLYYLGVIKKQITFSFYDLFFLLHYGFFLCVGSAAFVSFWFVSFRFVLDFDWQWKWGLPGYRVGSERFSFLFSIHKLFTHFSFVFPPCGLINSRTGRFGGFACKRIGSYRIVENYVT